MSRTVILTHSGKQHSYHVAKALLDLGRLERFYTSSYVTQRWIQELITKTGNQYWSRRFEPRLGGSKVQANWRFELKEILYSKLYGTASKTLDAVYQRDVAFDRYIARKMSKLKGDIHWGFQGSSLESLKAARKAGKLAVCELSTAHAPAARRILGEEKELHSEWADSFDNLDFPPAYYERLCREPEEADLVIGASRFTIQTLEQSGIPANKLRYLPLGFDAGAITFNKQPDREMKPLRLLYAGRVTQRKGIRYLLEAMKAFDHSSVRLDIIGHVHGSGAALRSYNGLYTLHKPLSQTQLFSEYGKYDALVLPSVFEGFGLVIPEAMAAGLPVIATHHTIGPELIRHGINGYIVNIRDINAIVQSIKDLSGKSPEERSIMREAARTSAMQYSWAAYKERLRVLMDTL